MKVDDILIGVRKVLDDETGYDSEKLWKTSELLRHLKAALNKLCREAKILKDSDTVDETLATGKVTLIGTAGSVSSVAVNDVDITSAAVPFDTSLATTATNLAANINAYTSSPNYTASASGAKVTISAVAGTGSNPNRFDVTTVGTGGITATDVDMSGGYALCRLYFVTGVTRYDLDSRIIQVIKAELPVATKVVPLLLKPEDWMDKNYSNWRDAAASTPAYAITDKHPRALEIVPPPDEALTVSLKVTRLPIKVYDENDMQDTLELDDYYEDAIINLIAAMAFDKHDTETYKPNMILYYEKKADKIIDEALRFELLKSKGRSQTVAPRYGNL